METVKRILKKYKKSLLAGAIFLLLSVLFHLLKRQQALMTWYVDNITGPFKRFIAWVCNFTVYSVTEWLLILAVIAALVFIVWNVIKIIRAKGARIEQTAGFAIAVLDSYLIIAFLMNALWGANYYAANFKQRADITTGEYSVEQLYETTLYFAEQASICAGNVARDEIGMFSENIDDILSYAPALYNDIAVQYPFLAGRELRVKKVVFSRVMSYMNTTGVTFPFTGEASVNIDAPASLLPVTAAHEIAHQRNIASEQEANFLAILVSTQSGIAAYEYSGYLLGFINLSNALYREDPVLYYEVMTSVSDYVMMDMVGRIEYWRYFQTPISEASDNLYDDFLKGYGEELGTKSYGAVVDLLIAYYGPKT